MGLIFALLLNEVDFQVRQASGLQTWRKGVVEEKTTNV